MAALVGGEWGTGRLVCEAAEARGWEPPVVVPFFHAGLEDVMPTHLNARGVMVNKHKLPRVGHTVRVVAGEEVDVAAPVDQLRRDLAALRALADLHRSRGCTATAAVAARSTTSPTMSAYASSPSESPRASGSSCGECASLAGQERAARERQYGIVTGLLTNVAW